MRLTVATREHHLAVDEPWLDLLRPSVSVADYASVLLRTYGLVAPFESACRYTPGIDSVFDTKRLTRSGLIAQDLLLLGMTPLQVAAISTCSSIEMFAGVDQALGWLYVVERSTLLQDGVRRHLLRHIPQIKNATNFLAAYEGHVSDHWKELGRILDRFNDEPHAAAIVEAARHAFEISRAWLRGSKTEIRGD